MPEPIHKSFRSYPSLTIYCGQVRFRINTTSGPMLLTRFLGPETAVPQKWLCNKGGRIDDGISPNIFHTHTQTREEKPSTLMEAPPGNTTSQRGARPKEWPRKRYGFSLSSHRQGRGLRVPGGGGPVRSGSEAGNFGPADKQQLAGWTPPPWGWGQIS